MQLELVRNAGTQTHKLLMNYLSNSTGIYIRLRQHPPLKSSPHLPRIPKEALTEVKFLYVNTGNAESPTCSAIASALVALFCAGEHNGAVLQALCYLSMPTKASLLLPLTNIFTLVNAASHRGR